MAFRTLLTVAAVIASVVGAALGLYAASIEIHNNLDALMDDMSRQGWWATWVATAGCAAAALSATERLIKLHRERSTRVT
jgi:hypothetical protein